MREIRVAICGRALALRGHAGQPGPRAENRERGQQGHRWKVPRSSTFPIIKHHRESRKIN
jgi:hypothetical protein